MQVVAASSLRVALPIFALHRLRLGSICLKGSGSVRQSRAWGNGCFKAPEGTGSQLQQ